MRFCQSERAIKAREWRATQREKRRFDTLLSDYAKVKIAELNDEDKGIGLNVDTELEAVVEPFDYQLEMEGVDW